MEIDNVKTILDAGAAVGAKVQTVLGLPVLVTPTSASLLTGVQAEADARADKPLRRKGTANLQSVDSFCQHVNRFKSLASVVWADAAARKFVGVLNYHPEGAASDPAWGDHRAVYPCPLSTEWQAWGQGREMKLSQDAFATALVRREKDLAANAGASADNPYPSPADLMTLAANLETYNNMKSKRERDPRTGKMSVSFSEDTGIKGNVTIPPAFAVKIPIFEDSLPVLVEVSLRMEIVENAPVFVIGISDADKVLRAAFAGLMEAVKTACELPVFVGTPE